MLPVVAEIARTTRFLIRYFDAGPGSVIA